MIATKKKTTKKKSISKTEKNSYYYFGIQIICCKFVTPNERNDNNRKDRTNGSCR